ncbi:unnamed protein product, partial [Rotaria magnacalcarata]
MTLRTIVSGGSYASAHLYEVVLSKLGGEGNLRNEKEFFFNIEEKGFFSLPWTLGKTVFYHLLKKYFDADEAQLLYAKIICEFEFKLLIKLETSDFINRLQYQFLLHEICNKVAYDAANCLGKEKKIVVKYIVNIQESINDDNQSLNKEKRKEKSVKNLTFLHKNFETVIPKNLKGLQFIKEHIISNSDSPSSNALRKQFSGDAYDIEKYSKNVLVVELNRILDEITQYYGFNRVIQILQLIENFVFSIVQHNGFRILSNHEISNVELCRILIRIANLYYNCSAIISSELYHDENLSYEPIYYTKLILILFSLYAMVDDLVRKDQVIGSSLKNYTLNTDLQKISLKSIIPHLALPTRKWFDLLKNIEQYFKLFTTNVEESKAKGHCLFHYSSLSIDNNSDENNIDVMYVLNLLKNNFPDNYTTFQETLKGIKVDQLKNKWEELLFRDKYLPELLRYLRDISYLSQLSLCGLPLQAIQKMKYSSSNDTKMYSRFKCNFDKSLAISGLGIQMDSSSDRRRFFDFILPKDQKKYQRLITFNFDKNQTSNITENEIIGIQNEKPENLTKPQYYHLCSIQLYDELRFTLMYIALKNDE